MARRVVLVSPLSPTAMATRLREVLGDRDAAPRKGVTGQGSEAGMLLFYHRPNLTNSFRTQLTATMEAEGSGTRIKGKLGSPVYTKVFMGCWFAFLTVFICIASAAAFVSGKFLLAVAPLILIPLVLMVFGVVLSKAGTWNAAKDEAAILEFLKQTVQAVPQ